jgi:hypothetical protein
MQQDIIDMPMEHQSSEDNALEFGDRPRAIGKHYQNIVPGIVRYYHPHVVWLCI